MKTNEKQYIIPYSHYWPYYPLGFPRHCSRGFLPPHSSYQGLLILLKKKKKKLTNCKFFPFLLFYFSPDTIFTIYLQSFKSPSHCQNNIPKVQHDLVSLLKFFNASHHPRISQQMFLQTYHLFFCHFFDSKYTLQLQCEKSGQGLQQWKCELGKVDHEWPITEQGCNQVKYIAKTTRRKVVLAGDVNFEFLIPATLCVVPSGK